MDVQVKSTKELKYGNNYIPFWGTYNVVVKDENLKYPKSLLKEAVKWVKGECDRYKIDFSQYKYVEITQFDGVTYQVDFYQNEKCENEHLSLYGIFLSGSNRKILQANFGL